MRCHRRAAMRRGPHLLRHTSRKDQSEKCAALSSPATGEGLKIRPQQHCGSGSSQKDAKRRKPAESRPPGPLSIPLSARVGSVWRRGRLTNRWRREHRGLDAAKAQRNNNGLPTMQPNARIALFPHSCGRGEVVLRAYECLREAGISPVGYAFNDEPRITLTSKTRKRGLAALLAGGFDFKEI